MNQTKNKKAFTLVELIVVITILAILGTIAFISLQGYSRDARDSVRQSDIANIVSSLTLYETQRGTYPEPTSGIDITFSGGQVWNQGTIGDSVISNLSQLSTKPVDPLTGTEYTYSRLNTKKEFEVAAALEGGLTQNINIINQAKAAGTLLGTAYVKGDYNQMVAKVNTGSTTYILAVPTIISGDVSLTDILKLMQSGSLVYAGANNLPSNYRGTTFNVDGGGFTYNPGDIVSYTGTTASLTDINNQVILLKGLQDIYTGTDSSTNNDNISKLVNTTIVLGNPSNATKVLASIIVKNNINSNVSIFVPVVQELSFKGDIVGYWDFDNYSGTGLYDNSGLGNTGTLINNVLIENTVSNSNRGYYGKFDGVSSYVSVPDSPELSGGTGKSISLSAWFKEEVDNTVPASFVNKYLDGSYKDYSLALRTDGLLRFYLENGAGNDFALDTAYTFTIGTWYNVVNSFNGTTLKSNTYVNGVLINSGTSLYSLPDTTANLQIGKHGYFSEYYKGLIDDVMVVKKALSLEEVLELYNKQK